MRKKKKIQEDIQIAKGVLIRPENWRQEEKRTYTLMLKALFVYLVVMGAIGCYLTSLDVMCSQVIIHISVLLAAMFCSFLYYSNLWENLGYVLLLFLLLFVGVSLRSYISSGFLATLNELSEQSSVYFGSKAVKRYAESVSNQYLAITVAFCYVGWVACVLINVFVSRRMQYVWATIFSISALMMPLYIEKEPATVYIIMLVAGLVMCFVFRGNGHYHLTRNNQVYEFLGKKRKIQYVYAGKTLAGGMLSCLLLCICLVSVVSVAYPQEKYEVTRTDSELKGSTMNVMQNFLQLGIMGLFNRYQSTGGLTSGRLGGVSSISLDYEPDLEVTYVPYDNERLYLRNFLGANYIPYSNRWEYLRNEDGLIQRTVPVDGTSSFYRSLYDQKDKKAGKGIMEVKNLAADERGYMPYYSEDVNHTLGPMDMFAYTYYIYQGEPPKMKKEYVNRDHTEQWLSVPDENRETIQKLCSDAGMTREDSAEELVSKMTTYFRQNIPYTYSPGATPYKQDFINHFVNYNRKGYCAHFASTATLAFREMGLPARYAEGYAIDPTDLSDEGKILPDKKYEDYYSGNNIVNNTSVVSVKATDGDAHAWVEVYVEGKGWKVAEVTPPSYGEEESTMSLMQRLMQLFKNVGNEDGVDSGNTQTEDTTLISPEMQRKTLYAIGVVVLGVALVFFGIIFYKKIRLLICYVKAKENDRVILWYGKFLRKKQKKYPELKECINYRDQINWLSAKETWQMSNEELKQIISLLEKAGFSNKTLSENEIQTIKKKLK